MSCLVKILFLSQGQILSKKCSSFETKSMIFDDQKTIVEIHVTELTHLYHNYTPLDIDSTPKKTNGVQQNKNESPKLFKIKIVPIKNLDKYIKAKNKTAIKGINTDQFKDGRKSEKIDPELCKIENITRLSDFLLRGESEFIIESQITTHHLLRSLSTYLSFVCKNLIGEINDPVDERDQELKMLIERFRNIEQKKTDGSYFLKIFDSILKI